MHENIMSYSCKYYLTIHVNVMHVTLDVNRTETPGFTLGCYKDCVLFHVFLFHSRLLQGLRVVPCFFVSLSLVTSTACCSIILFCFTLACYKDCVLFHVFCFTLSCYKDCVMFDVFCFTLACYKDCVLFHIFCFTLACYTDCVLCDVFCYLYYFIYLISIIHCLL